MKKYLLIFTLFLFTSCDSDNFIAQKCKKMSSKDISCVVYDNYSPNLLECISRLNIGMPKCFKSLNSKLFLEDNIVIFGAFISINTINKSVIFDFEKFDTEVNYNYRYSFDVLINNHEKVYIEGIQTSVNNIKENAILFLSQPDSVCNCYELEQIKYFGNTLLPNLSVSLTIETTDINGLTKQEWELFSFCMKELISIYEDRREIISINKWGVKFSSLSLEKKIAVSEYVNFRMNLIFEKQSSNSPTTAQSTVPEK